MTPSTRPWESLATLIECMWPLMNALQKCLCPPTAPGASEGRGSVGDQACEHLYHFIPQDAQRTSLWLCRLPRASPPAVLVQPAPAALLPAVLEGQGFVSQHGDINVPSPALCGRSHIPVDCCLTSGWRDRTLESVPGPAGSVAAGVLSNRSGLAPS